MSNKLNKIYVDRSEGNATTYRGRLGDIFYDPDTDVLRIANGTPGGRSVGSSIKMTFPTYASITGLVPDQLVVVTADETNGGLKTLYFYDGTDLLWIPMV